MDGYKGWDWKPTLLKHNYYILSIAIHYNLKVTVPARPSAANCATFWPAVLFAAILNSANKSCVWKTITQIKKNILTKSHRVTSYFSYHLCIFLQVMFNNSSERMIHKNARKKMYCMLNGLYCCVRIRLHIRSLKIGQNSRIAALVKWNRHNHKLSILKILEKTLKFFVVSCPLVFCDWAHIFTSLFHTVFWRMLCDNNDWVPQVYLQFSGKFIICALCRVPFPSPYSAYRLRPVQNQHQSDHDPEKLFLVKIRYKK